MERKYFGIGLPRTGTSSLHQAFLDLGLRSVHFHADQDTRRQFELADFHLKVMGGTDLLCDHGVIPAFLQLFDAWPDSRFIYTVRDEESWVRSLHHVDFMQQTPRIGSHAYYAHLSLYGCIVFREGRFWQVYRDHDARVRRFFSGDRASRLLIMDIRDGDGYDILAPFLGLPVPGGPFPQRNRDGTVERGHRSLARTVAQRLKRTLG